MCKVPFKQILVIYGLLIVAGSAITLGFWIGSLYNLIHVIPLYNTTYQTPYKYYTYPVKNCRVCNPSIEGPGPGFSRPPQVCYDVDGYKGYVVTHYVTWTNCRPTTYVWLINSNGCWATIDNALRGIQMDYPMGTKIYGYYNIFTPPTWVPELPGKYWYSVSIFASLACTSTVLVIMIVHFCIWRWYPSYIKIDATSPLPPYDKY